MKGSKKIAALLGAVAAVGVAGSADAKVLITEVLANEVGSALTGEWVEIMNTGAAPVDVSNYKFGDEETLGGDTEAGGMFQFPANTLLAPGQVVVVANSAERFLAVYGFKPTFEAWLNATVSGNNDPEVPDMLPYLAWVNPGEAINMANGNDQAILLDANDAVADALSWGNVVAFDPGISNNPGTLDGQSYYRLTLEDTNTAADWGLTPDGGTAATRSTPGVVTAVLPEPGTMTLVGLAGLACARRRRKA